MNVTPAQIDRMESEGWMVTAGLWTAHGHRVLLRRGDAERILTIVEDATPCRRSSPNPTFPRPTNCPGGAGRGNQQPAHTVFTHRPGRRKGTMNPKKNATAERLDPTLLKLGKPVTSEALENFGVDVREVVVPDDEFGPGAGVWIDRCGAYYVFKTSAPIEGQPAEPVDLVTALEIAAEGVGSDGASTSELNLLLIDAAREISKLRAKGGAR